MNWTNNFTTAPFVKANIKAPLPELNKISRSSLERSRSTGAPFPKTAVMPLFTKIVLPGCTNLESSSHTLKYFGFRARLACLRSTNDTYRGSVIGSIATSAARRAFEAEADNEAARAELPMSAGALVGRDAREGKALELGRALAGFGSAAFLPRDGNDPRDAASGVAESSEDSED